MRGHFPLETEVLSQVLDLGEDGVILIPAFIEGGRVTVGNIHYVIEGKPHNPVAETEYACDATFGYRNSDLREWIVEKTGGRTAARDVECVSLDLIRAGGAEAVRGALMSVARSRYFVINATTYDDLEVFVHGLLLAERAGRRYLIRTAASFVRVRAGFASLGAKGGITASDLAVLGLCVRRATVLGQAAAGVPVWQLGNESRMPGVPYVIFPGNVGSQDTLRDLLEGITR